MTLPTPTEMWRAWPHTDDSKLPEPLDGEDFNQWMMRCAAACPQTYFSGKDDLLMWLAAEICRQRIMSGDKRALARRIQEAVESLEHVKRKICDAVPARDMLWSKSDLESEQMICVTTDGAGGADVSVYDFHGLLISREGFPTGDAAVNHAERLAKELSDAQA